MEERLMHLTQVYVTKTLAFAPFLASSSVPMVEPVMSAVEPVNPAVLKAGDVSVSIKA